MTWTDEVEDVYERFRREVRSLVRQRLLQIKADIEVVASQFNSEIGEIIEREKREDPVFRKHFLRSDIPLVFLRTNKLEGWPSALEGCEEEFSTLISDNYPGESPENLYEVADEIEEQREEG
jgi:hypothetical protein